MDLARGRIQQITTTHYLGDALGGIVDYGGKVIGGFSVAAKNNEVTHLPSQTLLEYPLHPIVQPNGLGIGNYSDRSCWFAVGNATAAGTGIGRSGQLFSRAGAGKRRSAIGELLQGLLVVF